MDTSYGRGTSVSEDSNMMEKDSLRLRVCLNRGAANTHVAVELVVGDVVSLTTAVLTACHLT